MNWKSIKFFRAAVLSLSVLVLGVIAFCTLPPPGTIPVLMYHFVGDPKSIPSSEGNFVSPQALEMQMEFLKKFRYRVISLDTYYNTLRGARESEGREVVITFDDGDFTFAEKAVPILEKYKFPVTMFLVSGLIEKGENGSMNLETIKKLQKDHGWINFQSHTQTHAHLLEISDEQLKNEMEKSRLQLMELLGTPVRDLSYPYGEFDKRVMEAAEKAGYRMAFTTGYKRLKGINEGLFSMTRIKMSRIADSAPGFWYTLSGLHQWIKGASAKLKHSFRS